MTITVIKVLGDSVMVNTANVTFTESRLVRLLNTDTDVGLITIYDTAANTSVGDYYVGAGQEVILELPKDNALTANSDGKVLGCAIAFRY